MRDHYAINKQMNLIFDTWVYIICVHRSTLRSKCTQIRKILLLVCCYDDRSRIWRNFRKMISFCWRKNISIWWKVFPLRMMKNCFKLMTMKNCFKWQCCSCCCFAFELVDFPYGSLKVVAISRLWYNWQPSVQLGNIMATLHCCGIRLSQLYNGKRILAATNLLFNIYEAQSTQNLYRYIA